MAAIQFDAISTGPNVAAAFATSVQQARRDNAGRTAGTVAGKLSYQVITAPSEAVTDMQRIDYAIALMDDPDRPAWLNEGGEAGAIQLSDTEDGKERWIFFGYVST